MIDAYELSLAYEIESASNFSIVTMMDFLYRYPYFA